MPKSAVPKYRRQLGASGEERAFVVLGGRRVYLGPYGTPESKERYARAVAEWEAADRRVPIEKGEAVTVVELAAAFWDHAQAYYRRPDGSPTEELANFKPILALMRDLYGETPAAEFGPKRLRALRQKLIERGGARGYINSSIARLKRVFRWAVAEEMVSPVVHQALEAVPGLRRGRSEARETAPVRPVAEKDIEAVLPYLSEELRAVARLQLLSGARSGEILAMRPADLDMSGAVWTFTPADHKNAHRDHARTIFLGPQAQDVLRPFLADCGLLGYVFSPRRAEERRLARRHAERRTPATYGNVPGSNRTRNPKRRPGERYKPRAYAHAVRRACERAGVNPWHPHRLRHAAGTRFRREFNIDVARALLGHRTLRVTDTYAEIDAAKAVEVMAKIG
jgi:integrase